MAKFVLLGGVVQLDEIDAHFLTTATWRVNRQGYVISNRGPSGRYQALHRLILAAPDGVDVDHINGDPADNRRVNLRLASRAENSRNRKVHRTSKTGIRGVHFCEREKRYVAAITKDYKKRWLGYFNTPEEASAAYAAASAKLHGEFGRVT